MEFDQNTDIKATLQNMFKLTEFTELEVGESYTILIVADDESEIRDAKDMVDECLAEADLDEKLTPVVRKTSRLTTRNPADGERLKKIGPGKVGVGIERVN